VFSGRVSVLRSPFSVLGSGGLRILPYYTTVGLYSEDDSDSDSDNHCSIVPTTASVPGGKGEVSESPAFGARL
jgi:hypothetical protein